MESRYSNRIQDRLIHALTQMVWQARDLEKAMAPEIRQIEADYRDSARNLIHYLSARQHDLRKLQADLSSLGLSSLGRMESHTMASLEAVLETLHRLTGGDLEALELPAPPVSFRLGPVALEDHANALLGRSPPNRAVRIMVTMPSEAARDPGLITQLLEAGMDVMRVNCAHDDASDWFAMIEHLRRAERRLGRRCKVLADLAGPKLRTGPLRAVDRVKRLKPKRDHRGELLKPVRIWFTPADQSVQAPTGCDMTLQLEGDCPVIAGKMVELQNTAGKFTPLRVIDTKADSFLAELDRTVYVAEGASLRITSEQHGTLAARVTGVPEVQPCIVLHPGDLLRLTRSTQPGGPAEPDSAVEADRMASIGCSLDAVFDSARPGDSIWFDDGKIAGAVEHNDGEEITVRISRTKPGGSKLRADKGINLPETDLRVPALTDRDLINLEQLISHIDMVGLSFVRRPEDVIQLEDRLHDLGAGHLGIVLKIENRMAFENLPKLLLAGMRSPPVGVMVARGDLAVEVGFERLSEVQEEILWVCEAAHVPVIWATQVLEDMAKTGMPSRAEVTDAAMSGRAECVMLNKGPYMKEVVEFLSGVLERMEAHQSKKSAMLRRLSISDLKTS